PPAGPNRIDGNEAPPDPRKAPDEPPAREETEIGVPGLRADPVVAEVAEGVKGRGLEGGDRGVARGRPVGGPTAHEGPAGGGCGATSHRSARRGRSRSTGRTGLPARAHRPVRRRAFQCWTTSARHRSTSGRRCQRRTSGG